MDSENKINNKRNYMNEWDSIELPIVREAFTELLVKKLISVQPMGREEYLGGKEARQYPNKYDDFTDIQSLEWYLLDEIERLKIDVNTLRIGKSITWPLNLKDKEYKYIDDVGTVTITGWSEDLNGGEEIKYTLDRVINKPQMNKIEVNLNPQRWNNKELHALIEKIKETI